MTAPDLETTTPNPGVQVQTYRDPNEVLAEKLAQPADLERQLQAYDRNRKALVRFIGTHLVEADYEKRDGLSVPKPGAMNDYYMVPGSEQKALTKLGGEKLGSLFRYFRGDTQVTHQVCTKDLCEVRVKVSLVDQYSRVVGSFESACTTQEKSFQSAWVKKKYGNDYRAALNDIIARASKRAFVQAMIYSTATDEIFQAAADPEEQRAEAEEVETPPPAAKDARLPAGKFGKWGSQLIRDVPTPDLAKIYLFCSKEAKRPEVWAPIADAVANELDDRRAVEDDDDDLAF